MADSSNAVLYSAVYENKDDALADLDAFEQLHDEDLIGDYDAAVVDKEEGKAHIVKRVDHPRVRVISEAFGGGELKRSELYEAADELEGDEAALIVVGEPTIQKGFDQAVTRTTKTVQKEFDADTQQLAKEVREAEKQAEQAQKQSS